jgi:hypothetical protein
MRFFKYGYGAINLELVTHVRDEGDAHFPLRQRGPRFLQLITGRRAWRGRTARQRFGTLKEVIE